jgi:hypothetical protein
MADNTSILPRKEYYHTMEEFQSVGLESFLKHTREFIKGIRSIPISLTSSEYHDRRIYFTFSDCLMIRFRDTKEMYKPYEAAIKYGFRGYSAGGRNGIFLFRKSDKGLRDAMPVLIRQNLQAILLDLEVSEKEIDDLLYVKIVCHDISGKRVVGVMNTKNDRILFLNFAEY